MDYDGRDVRRRDPEAIARIKSPVRHAISRGSASFSVYVMLTM